MQLRVERSLIVRWVVGSILDGGPIELFLIPAICYTTDAVNTENNVLFSCSD